MRILVWKADVSGCFLYRVKIPMAELKRYGVDYNIIPSIPVAIDKPVFRVLYELVSEYDLVVVQRCPKLEVVRPIRDICDFLNKPLVFETDDDYFHIPKHNPGYAELGSEEQKAKYIEILRMADAITVTTLELANLLRPHNKNVHVFPNNVDYIPAGENSSPKRDIGEARYDEDGKIEVKVRNDLCSIPAYYKHKGETHRIVRVGYTATSSHRVDFETIKAKFDKFLTKYERQIWLVIIGDGYFHEMYKNYSRLVPVPVAKNFDAYYDHLRNLDIGIAPLERDLFNVCKSPIKAVEYGMWGIPAVLPNYITYTREFEHNKNCLMYNNANEFIDCLEELVNNTNLRDSLGTAARDHVRDNRLEKHHVKSRYELYKSLVDQKRKIYYFTPEGNKVND